MGKKIVYFVVCISIFIYVNNLYASPADEIQRRIDIIQSKIDDGIKTGQLTEQESKNLQHR
ncbi:MAG: hypothetical protein N2596_08200, partial [Syntrophorhabdaceae bacterium]|nr:hypothetical protein [Syntrophorhabdaceae bacterium]